MSRNASNQIPIVAKGDIVEADLFNRIAAAAVRSGKLRVGPGLSMRAGTQGIVIAIDPGWFRNRSGWMDARISAASGGAGPGVASGFVYSVVVNNRPDLPEYTGLTPTLGRPVRPSDTTTEIYPASVGDACDIRLRRNGDNTTTPELRVGTEVLAVEDCDPGAVSQPNSLALGALVDHIAVDADGSIVVDADGFVVTDGAVNAIQQEQIIDRAVADADGSIVADADGFVVLDADADEEAIALWDAVVVDADGSIVADADGNIVTEELDA